jgi:hypothetical protein
MRLDEIDEKCKITLNYTDYEELKEALNLCKSWLWKLRNNEELTDEERHELIEFMFKYFHCL